MSNCSTFSACTYYSIHKIKQNSFPPANQSDQTMSTSLFVINLDSPAWTITESLSEESQPTSPVRSSSTLPETPSSAMSGLSEDPGLALSENVLPGVPTFNLPENLHPEDSQPENPSSMLSSTTPLAGKTPSGNLSKQGWPYMSDALVSLQVLRIL